MGTKKNSFIIGGIVLFVAAPALIAMAAYQITENPALRPLARTKNDVAIHQGEIVANSIYAKIRWTTGRGKNFSQQDLEGAIRTAFKRHGVQVVVLFEEVDSTDTVSITYQVGINTFGPTPIYKTEDGIKGAIIAYRMYQAMR